MTTLHSFKMFGTSHPVTQHRIQYLTDIVQYGLLLAGSGGIRIEVNGTFVECELSRTGDTKLKVHLKGQATEVHLIRNSFS